MVTRANPFVGRDILIPSPETPNTLTTKPILSAPVNKVVQAIDWRGKITPDSVRYKLVIIYQELFPSVFVFGH